MLHVCRQRLSACRIVDVNKVSTLIQPLSPKIQYLIIIVRELVGWVRNVVLINVYLDLENPGGSGFRVRGHMG